MSLAFKDPFSILFASIGRLGPEDTVECTLFKTMCRPADDPSDGEHRREEIGVETKAAQKECCEKQTIVDRLRPG